SFTVAIDTGTFDRLFIHIHKPENGDTPGAAAFLAAHPEFVGASLRAVGTFNGTPFVYTSDLNAVQQMALVPPLAVTDSSTAVSVTIKVDVTTWFANGSGGLVNPATALKGGANENLVRDNIRDSFHAFRDDDCDGRDDHEEHHGHD